MADNKQEAPEQDQEAPEVETPSFLTSEQFNKAITAREKAFEKRMAKQQEDFNNILKGFAPPSKEEPALSRTAELERTVKDLSRNLQERDNRDKEQRLRSLTERALLDQNIDPEWRDQAASFLIDSKKAIKYDSDGQIIMTIDGVEYEDIEEGMAVWANSKQARLYKTPSTAQGSGDKSRKSAKSKQVAEPSKYMELKHKDKWQESNEKKLTLTRDNKIALSQAIFDKLKSK